MEKSMQQVQSEQDKMVPIDTSGESVEIELKDDKAVETKEEPKEEIVVEQQSTETKNAAGTSTVLKGNTTYAGLSYRF